MSVADDFTDIQWDALLATATRHLRDPEELGREIRPLVFIDPFEPVTPATETSQTAVNIELTYMDGRTDTVLIPATKQEPTS